MYEPVLLFVSDKIALITYLVTLFHFWCNTRHYYKGTKNPAKWKYNIRSAKNASYNSFKSNLIVLLLSLPFESRLSDRNCYYPCNTMTGTRARWLRSLFPCKRSISPLISFYVTRKKMLIAFLLYTDGREKDLTMCCANWTQVSVFLKPLGLVDVEVRDCWRCRKKNILYHGYGDCDFESSLSVFSMKKHIGGYISKIFSDLQRSVAQWKMDVEHWKKNVKALKKIYFLLYI